MEDRLIKAIKEFNLLSKAEKQKYIVQWVKRGSKSVLPILKRISTEDSEVQIRYMARKGLYHLRKRLKMQEPAFKKDINFSKLSEILDMKLPQKTAKVVEFCVRENKLELVSYIHENISDAVDPFILSSYLIALGRLGNEEQFEVIKPFLEHKDSRVRASAVEALGNLGTNEVNPWLLKALNDDDNRIRANAIKALRVKDRELVFKSLGQMVESDRVWMRNSAAFAIGEYKTDEVLDLLPALILDESESVQRMARNSLEKLANNGIVKASLLLDRTKELKGDETVSDFLKLLSSDVEEEVKKQSSNRMEHEDSSIRLMEINHIVQDSLVERYKELESRLVVEEDNYVKATLILSLGKVKQESAVPLLKTFLNHEVPRIRANAIEALASFGKKEYLPQIILHLDETNNRARANAIVALKEMPYVDVISPLKDMCISQDMRIKHSAFYAIMELNSRPAIELLDELSFEEMDNALSKNIREYFEMTEMSDDWFVSLKDNLSSRFPEPAQEEVSEFDLEEADETEEVTEEVSLSKDISVNLTEDDFEDFRPDNVEKQQFESIDTDSFFKASPAQKVQMIDFMKDSVSQEHFTILRYAEQDNDFQVKCLAKIALNSYKEQSFAEEQLEHVEVDKKGNVDISSHILLPEVGIDRQRIEYEGAETVQVLNQELHKRSLDYKSQGFWEGKFGIRRKTLCALRQDTQEMLETILDDEKHHVECIGLCYYSPTFKPFLEGSKSLDGLAYENFIQLNSEKTRLIAQDKCDCISEYVKSVASPKYLMLLVSHKYLVVFLRYTLQYTKAEYIKIPLERITNLKVEKEQHINNVVLEIDKQERLLLPKMQLKNARELISTIEDMKT
jgi:HEAT repeat protein